VSEITTLVNEEKEYGDPIFTGKHDIYSDTSITSNELYGKPDIETYVITNALNINLLYKKDGILLPIRKNKNISGITTLDTGVYIVNYYNIYDNNFEFLKDAIPYYNNYSKDLLPTVIDEILLYLEKCIYNRLNKSRLRIITYIPLSDILEKGAVHIGNMVISTDIDNLVASVINEDNAVSLVSLDIEHYSKSGTPMYINIFNKNVKLIPIKNNLYNRINYKISKGIHVIKEGTINTDNIEELTASNIITHPNKFIINDDNKIKVLDTAIRNAEKRNNIVDEIKSKIFVDVEQQHKIADLLLKLERSSDDNDNKTYKNVIETVKLLKNFIV